MINIKNLTARYDDTVILDDFNLEVKEGEAMAVLGPSGVGKTTLLRCMIGLLEAHSGEIVINGQNIANLSEQKMNEIRRSFGVLFQSGALSGDCSRAFSRRRRARTWLPSLSSSAPRLRRTRVLDGFIARACSHSARARAASLFFKRSVPRFTRASTRLGFNSTARS